MAEAHIAAVVLAAGGSTRFGRPKQLLDWEGRPLVAHTADVAWMAGLDPVVVVTGSHAEDVIAVLASRPVKPVRNYRWKEGLSTSLAAGLAVLPVDIEAALFLPVDQPLITPQLLRRFVDLLETERDIIVPQTPEGDRGTPVLFGRAYFPELACLSGDVGGRVLLSRYQDRIRYLTVSDPLILTDADTPEKYKALQARVSDQPRLSFGDVQGIICDMDGVLWRGNSALPGLGRFFDLIHDLSLAYVLVTNNSSRTPEQYVEKLAQMGVTTTPEHVLNSSVATARYIADRKRGARVYAIGADGVKAALKAQGLVYRDDNDVEDVDFVVVGWDRQLTWRKLATATRLILNGATFVSTNPDRTFPLETGVAPGNGAQTAALEAATAVEPITVGKPSPPLYEQALARMGTTPDATLVIGDRLDTDILGGIRLGMATALTLSGVSHRDDLVSSPIHPTAIFEDLPSLIEAWRRKGTRP